MKHLPLLSQSVSSLAWCALFGQFASLEQVQVPLLPPSGLSQWAPDCEPQSESFWQPTCTSVQPQPRGHSAAFPGSQPSAQAFLLLPTPTQRFCWPARCG